MKWQIDPDVLAQDAQKVDEMPIEMLMEMRRVLRSQYVVMPDDGLERVLHKLDAIIHQKSRPN